MTTTELIERDTIDRVLKEALARGGNFAEVFCEDRSTSQTSMDQRRIEEMASSHERGAGIRVVVGETTGYAHTSDLSEAGLLAAARTAASVARSGTASAPVALGAKAVHPVRAEVLPSDVPKERRVELMQAADDAARSAGGDVSQVFAAVGDSRRRILVANSEGTYATDDLVRTRMNVMCVASGDTGMQTGYEPIAKTCGFEVFERGADDLEIGRQGREQQAMQTGEKLAAREISGRPEQHHS